MDTASDQAKSAQPLKGKVSYNTQKKATALGLAGWVRNLPDGRVEAVVEGNSARLTNLMEWFQSGPPAAEVKAVSTEEQPLQNFEGFEIRQ